MKQEEFFKIITAKMFFTVYCKDVKNWSHKRRGIDGNGKPIDFSESDKLAMQEAAKVLGGKLSKVKF